MEWWRAHHGLPYDAKLGLVAQRVNAPRAEVVAVWVALLDCASQAEDRGSIRKFDPDEAAFGLGMESGRVGTIVAGFKEKGLIDGGDRLTNWRKRQPVREDPTATERQRRKRDAMSRTVTPQSRIVTTEQSREEKSREEKSREDSVTRVTVTDLDGAIPIHAAPSERFDEAWAKWPLKVEKNAAGMAWVSVVTVDNESKVFACLERYLESRQAAQGIFSKLDKWLFQCHDDGWGCEWPRADGAKPKIVEKPPDGCPKCDLGLDGEGKQQWAPHPIQPDGTARRCTCARGQWLRAKDLERKRDRA